MHLNTESFQMLESVSMASGFLNMTLDTDSAGKNLCDKMWPAELDKQFKGAKFVGSGATACVYLASDARGSTVAIKVGKNSGKAKDAQLQSWKEECDDMKELRMKACEGGKDVLKLHEHYLPSCHVVGTYSKGAYYAMHAAGPTPIRDVPKLGYDLKTRKSVFAQFVQSVYALHVIDMSHNDLHGQNIVVDNDDLSVIDLGSLKTTERSWKAGYKRDSNAIWRWGAVLADCGEDAQWPQNEVPKGKSQKAAAAFAACVKSTWKPGQQFMVALRKLLKGNVNKEKDHHIIELYKTNFITQNTPELRSKFVSDVTGETKCLSWDKKEWEAYWFRYYHPNHVRCETVPHYEWSITKTKKGKTRTREAKQCVVPGQTFDSACYLKTKGELWACGGCGNNGETNPLACFFSTHPDYDKVPAYSE